MAAKNAGHNVVPKVYDNVIEEVITNVSEMFCDEGVDENVIQELRTLWKRKLKDSQALGNPPEEKKMTYIYMQKEQHILQNTKFYRPGQQQRIITNQPINRVVQQPGARLVPSNQASTVRTSQGGNIVQHNVVYQQGTGQRTVRNIIRPEGTRVILSRPPTSNIGTSRNITRVLPQSIQPNQQTVVQRQPVIRNIQNIRQNQLDGPVPEEDDDSEISETDDDESEHEEAGAQTDEEPLGSGDDLNDGCDVEIFETDNVVVCQFDKIQRVRNKWRLHLKDGIMNLKGKDYVFQKANGEADW